MTEVWRAVAALALAALVGPMLPALLGACASVPPPAPPPKAQGLVVLLPDAAGKATAVLVKQGTRELLLDQPYSAAQLTRSGPQLSTSSAAQVQAMFGAALEARPLPAAQFSLYFDEGMDEFTLESLSALASVVAEIARRPVPDVLVIGHTDTLGSDAANDALSRQRAEVGRRALVERGIGAQHIVVIGRGKRELAVPTRDGVADARNRRIEIQVR